MKNNLEDYLLNLEKKAEESDLKDMYLWPRTLKVTNFQDKICERVGARDNDVKNPRSRSFKMIKALKKLIKLKLIPYNFSLVDITCGDAVVLSELKKEFPEMKAYGVDCVKDKFDTHNDCYKQGIKIYNGYIQDMFKQYPEEKFDCAIMFNTYRGWESADLREHEKELPSLADEYFKNCINYTFLTGSYNQIKNLEARGFSVKTLGCGEDDSIMFVIRNTQNKEDYFKLTLWDKIKNNLLYKIAQKKGLVLNFFGIKIKLSQKGLRRICK